MARIAGVDLPPNKRIEIGLTYIYGIGRSQSNNILKAAAVSPDTKVRELNDDEVNKIERSTKGNNGTKANFARKFRLKSNGLLRLAPYAGLPPAPGFPGRGKPRHRNPRTGRGP